MSEGHSILELQLLDSSADQLRSRRAELLERRTLEAQNVELSALEQQRAEASERRVALEREERRVDTLVTDLESRIREVEGTLYSGKVTVPRELEALQLELRGFKRRLGELEEEELAVMEQVEQLAGEIAAMDARRDELEARTTELRAVIGTTEAQIDSEIGRISEQREMVASQLPAVLLATYEKLRAVPRLGGRVAVHLEGGTCSGCRVALPIAEVSRMRRDARDMVFQCPGCSRILALAPVRPRG